MTKRRNRITIPVIPARLKEAREKAGYSQLDAQALLGLGGKTSTQLSHIETGRRPVVRQEILIDMAKLYGVASPWEWTAAGRAPEQFKEDVLALI